MLVFVIMCAIHVHINVLYMYYSKQTIPSSHIIVFSANIITIYIFSLTKVKVQPHQTSFMPTVTSFWPWNLFIQINFSFFLSHAHTHTNIWNQFQYMNMNYVFHLRQQNTIKFFSLFFFCVFNMRLKIGMYCINVYKYFVYI